MDPGKGIDTTWNERSAQIRRGQDLLGRNGNETKTRRFSRQTTFSEPDGNVSGASLQIRAAKAFLHTDNQACRLRFSLRVWCSSKLMARGLRLKAAEHQLH